MEQSFRRTNAHQNTQARAFARDENAAAAFAIMGIIVTLTGLMAWIGTGTFFMFLDNAVGSGTAFGTVGMPMVLASFVAFAVSMARRG